MAGAAAGYSGTPLPRKLGIKEGALVATMGDASPRDFDRMLVADGPLPTGVTVTRGLPRGDAPLDVIVLFAIREDAIRDALPRARARLAEDGGLWIAWPKKTAKKSAPKTAPKTARNAPASDLDEARVRAAGLAAGLVDNKVCAIDATWSGLRFVVRVRDRRA